MSKVSEQGQQGQGEKLSASRPSWGARTDITDTDRLNALFTLFGGHYAFSPFFRVQEHFRDGRRGLDKFIFENPSLLGSKASNESSVTSEGGGE